jgi:peptide/nickel transport system substrate-binding protein
MSATTSRSRLATLAATAAIIVAACSGSTASPSTSASASPSESAAPTEAPFTAMSYPTSGGEVDCANKTFNGKPYAGEFKKISATDAKTVVFELCYPDTAFLSKIAFSSFAINDTEWLKSKVDPAAESQAIVQEPNGTGPWMLKEWKKGQEIVLVPNPNWRGEKPKASQLIFRWSAEASQRLVEIQGGTVDGIDNVSPTDFETVKADPNLQLLQRAALNTFYVGMSNAYKPFDNEKVRQAIAQAIDRQRIIDNFYPAGSEVAQYFTPCAIPNACVGDPWYGFDVAAAKKLMADAGYPNGFKTKLSYRNVVRGYLPDPKGVAQDIQAQLKANLGIDITLDEQESTTFLDNADAGKLDGLYLLGWGADYPDMTNFVDYHFGGGSSAQFGKHFDDLVAAISEGAAGANDDARKPSYEKVNNLIKQHVPMVPIAHGGSGVAYRADVGNPHVSPLGNEEFFMMTPGDRDTFVWMQNGEPGGLYCADESDGESLRVCEQILESLYGYEVAGTKAIPALAKECTPSADLMTWTCTLNDATFGNGATLDANDVVMSFGVQWDAADPLHKGRESSFGYFTGLFGAFINAPEAQ